MTGVAVCQRLELVPTPPPARDKFTHTHIELRDTSSDRQLDPVRLDSPHLLEAMRRTGICIEDIEPVDCGQYVLQASRQGKPQALAERSGTRRWKVQESQRQEYLEQLLSCRSQLLLTAESADTQAQQPQQTGAIKPHPPPNVGDSAAQERLRQIRAETLAREQERFHRDKKRLEDEETRKELARIQLQSAREQYLAQKAEKSKALQELRNKKFHELFRQAVNKEEEREAATAQAKRDEVERVAREEESQARRQAALQSEQNKHLAFARKQIARVEATRQDWNSRQEQLQRQMDSQATKAAKHSENAAQRIEKQRVAVTMKQQERARLREAKIARCKALKAKREAEFLQAQDEKLAKLSARLSARRSSHQREVARKQQDNSEKAERRRREGAEAYAKKLAKAKQTDAQYADTLIVNAQSNSPCCGQARTSSREA